jgi:hypothetical protein
LNSSVSFSEDEEAAYEKITSAIFDFDNSSGRMLPQE